ncbi:MAG: phosphoglucosamine mutase [Lachnospiraceae bacterium]|nr:phosphoglucosamine mutase [Lachnospiraceae bacterium]
MGRYFGTDGFRGEANVDLNVNHAYKIGRYLGYYFGKERPAKVVIAKDTRLSGYMFEYALVSGLMASGAMTYLLHVSPTPSVSYTVARGHFDCGIMISASHNPFYDNGIKIIDSEGSKLSPEIENKIEEYFDEMVDSLPFATKDKIGKTIDYEAGRTRYVRYLGSLPECRFDGMKIALDCGNGAASALAKPLFDRLGAETYVIHNQPNGMNINLNCGSTNLSDLSEYVVNNGFDVGFAYDGDADRCFAVDENGNKIDGDMIMYMAARFLKSKGKLTNNTVVATVTSNLGLNLALKDNDINLIQTDVGDRNVALEMFNNGYAIGGEQSGHIIFGEYAKTGDGLMTSLMIADIMRQEDKALSELVSGISIYPQLTVNVPVSDKKAAHNEPELLAEEQKILKEMNGKGRIYLRESGTEPVLRIMVEALTDELCHSYANRLKDILINKGYKKEG